MTIKELKQCIADLPDEMPVGLMDETTDDFYALNYTITKENFVVDDYVKEEDGEIEGKMLFITFGNKLNPNPIEPL